MRTQIIYENQDILVVKKPAGIAVESAIPSSPDVVSELKNYLLAKTGKRNPYLGLIHRIDQPVEGLLLFAKNKEKADLFSKKVSEGTLHKEYQAVIFGKLPKKEGTLTDYLVKENQMARILENPQGKNAKKAVLHYEVTGEYGEEATFVRVTIETGRFHQIRAQFSHAGYPLLGDRKYGTEKSIAYSKQKGIKNVALCADKITVPMKKGERIFSMEPENPAFQLH